ncbi:MAG: hypothetical protein C0522_12585 [Rhodocyclaceae bacterium]|nr:hypothetical protein [Rhodocyclaceae bacterium]
MPVADTVVARDCEMTISQPEFLRLLPAAVAGAAFEADRGVFTHGDADRGWRIALTPLPDLEHGLIRLPRQRAVFSFRGYSAGRITAFFQRFDLYFARGGG